jgi:hypothetical protein
MGESHTGHFWATATLIGAAINAQNQTIYALLVHSLCCLILRLIGVLFTGILL